MENNQILKIATYCLNCKTKPCMQGCPMKTNIPEFINKIKENKLEEAYKILIDNNIFSNICSLICPQEEQCEGHCTRGIKGLPVEIGKLEQYVNNWAKENKIEVKQEKANKKNKKVAIVGSGPAGLSCARELLKNGMEVTIFEKNDKLGGILRYGIPDFRLNKKLVDDIVKSLLNMGLQVKTNIEFGRDITIKNLKESGYDAIFLAIGAQIPCIYKLAEKEYKKVYTSDNFLKLYSENKKIDKLNTVAVIGGGNVAIDCARVAKKMGAKKVYIVYRRDRENMPARDNEINDAINEGVEIIYLTKVIEINGENNNIENIKCIKTRLENKKVYNIENSEFELKIDSFIYAIGLKPDRELIKNEGLELTDDDLIKIDENCKTNLENVYAGGDIVEYKSTVCKAVAYGKKVAQNIIERKG